MQDLQLIGVHEDGEHLLLSGADDERFQMPVDEALRAAIRRDRPRLGQLQIEVDGGLRPRDVQALIRAGASTEEAAGRAGWSVEKVRRYEGPILAEREHVAGLAQGARLRSRTGVSGGGSPTLSARVTERLKARDVEATDASWDSWRIEGGPWTVVLTFAAGGRQRQASWVFDLADRTVSAVDDEARWLSEEVRETRGPIPTPTTRPASGRETALYDLEAEGGLRPTAGDEQHEDPLDLMTAMRKRSNARGRRRPGGRSASTAAPKAVSSMPQTESHASEQALPLDDLEPHPATAAAPFELADHDLVVPDPSSDGSSSDETSRDETSRDETSRDEIPPDKTSPGEADRPQEPAKKSARPGQSAARPGRPAHDAARKTGRPSVPAWDEIMFGSRPDVDRSSS